jgi:two-component system, OmpR family, sensor histidine kinase KdpD
MQAVRFGLVVAAIGVITAINFRLQVNATTVALTFLVAVLLASAYWGLTYALVLAVGAAAAFNFFFLPPIKTFRITNPQDWVAFFAFLITAVVASNLSERARREAEAAKGRRREVELLFDLSQRLLASESELELLNALPRYVQETFSVHSVAMMASDNPSVYRSSPDAQVDENLLRLTVLRGEPTVQAGTAYVPLRLGVRTVGALGVAGNELSRETLDAIGSLAGLAIERARALEALSKHQAIQQNERLQSALLDAVTHEFHTPLTAIKTNLTTLLSTAAIDDHGERALLTAIDEQTDRLNRLVGEAAEMGQLDAGKFKLDLQAHPIQEALEPALQDAKASLENHPSEILLPPGLPMVLMDTQRIREVLMHLLDNAGKYSPAGTPIKVTAGVESGRMVISVADRGTGIDSLEQTMIFDKFYRGGRERYAAPGAGMGLPIAKVIMAAHGGSIGVVSQLGSGSVFSISLPVYPDFGATHGIDSATAAVLRSN